MKLIKYVILGIMVILGVNAILNGGEEEEETT